MTDLTPELNEQLKKYDSSFTTASYYSVPRMDQFLDEAYKINDGISELNTFLKGIRQSYLSKEIAPRRLHTTQEYKQCQHLTDRGKEQIDAKMKQVLRELNVGIRMLADAEEVRIRTETTILKKKYARLGLAGLGSWASGGTQSKPPEQEFEEAKANTITSHRESVLFYLRERLQKCVSLQASMMEKRITREIEKSRSMLGQAPSDRFPILEKSSIIPFVPVGNSSAYQPPEGQISMTGEELSPEQIQMFEQENQSMIRRFESNLDQVRTAEKSLVEISELQNQLVHNLATQSAHIEQLVTDSHLTTENIGGGNKQLRKATERKSTAKLVFYASCGLSLFLVVWDLIV